MDGSRTRQVRVLDVLTEAVTVEKCSERDTLVDVHFSVCI